MKSVKVGIIGCGNISEIYFKNAAKFGILGGNCSGRFNTRKSRC